MAEVFPEVELRGEVGEFETLLGIGKARRLLELHPEMQIKVLYQRDYLNLLVKYGLEAPSQLADATSGATGGAGALLDLRPKRSPVAGSEAESA